MPHETTAHRIELKKITAFDVVLIGAVLLLSMGVVFKTSLFQGLPVAVGAKAVVYRDGKEIQKIDLQKDGPIFLPGGHMVLAVAAGRVRVQQSDCHKRTCVHAGSIHAAGETIVCVPNKTVIEIIADRASVVDAVVF